GSRSKGARRRREEQGEEHWLSGACAGAMRIPDHIRSVWGIAQVRGAPRAARARGWIRRGPRASDVAGQRARYFPITTTRPPIFAPAPVGPPASTSTGASDACACRVNFARNGPPRAALFTLV